MERDAVPGTTPAVSSVAPGVSSVDDVERPATTRRRPFGSNPQVGARGTETEQKIFDAALEVFAEVGFNNARIELITQRAGCSRPAFYQYFSSKDEVFWKLARELGRRLVVLGRSLEKVGPDEAGLATLATWMDDFTTLYQSYAPLFTAFQSASRDHLELARESNAFSERLDTALLRAFGRGPRRRDQALASGMAAVIIRCNFYWDSMAASDTLDRARLTDGLARATHRLFHGPIVGVNFDPPEPPRTRAASAGPTFGPLPSTLDTQPLRARGRATRQRMLDAGAQVLPARGYHAARIDDIVATADVSHGSFYRYFSDKDDFFKALAEQTGAEMIELLERFPIDGDRVALRTWLEDWFESYRSNGGVITTWQELQEAGGELVAYSQQVAIVIVTGLIGMLEQRGHADALLDALVLLALIERLPYRTYTLNYTTPRAAIDAAATIVRRSILGLEG